MMLAKGNRSARRNPCPSATPTTTNPTWTNLGINPDLYSERLVPDRLSHGTSQLQLQYSHFKKIINTNSCNENKEHYWSIPTHFQDAQYQTYVIFDTPNKSEILTLLKRVPYFSLKEWKPERKR